MRFLKANVEFKGSECLPWPHAKYKNGYGALQYQGRMKSAAQVMCILANGEPPTPGMETAHSCGNGHLGCVNPHHLRWATHAENMSDRSRHGTLVQGEQVHNAVLTEDKVREIRNLGGTMPKSHIAKRYNVSEQTIRLIVQGRTWKHVT